MDALSVDEGYESIPTVTFREMPETAENLSHSVNWKEGKRRVVLNEDSIGATFLKMGHVGSDMPLNGRLAWNEGDGVKLQKLVRGQRFCCEALTGDGNLELEPLDVKEEMVRGGYRYVLLMMDGLGNTHELSLARENHKIRLFDTSD